MVRSGVARRLGGVSSAQVGCVAVVGGGVIGLSAAFELATSGIECVVIDPAPGRGASWAAAGMLSPAAEVAPGEGDLLADLQASAAMWPAFAQRVEEASSISVDYRTTGSLLVGFTRSDAREVERSVRQIRDAGIDVADMTSREATALEPCLASPVAAVWRLPGDHHVDNRLLVESLLGALKANGVVVIEDTCVEIDGAGVDLRLLLEHRGELRADRCILATGAVAPPGGNVYDGLCDVRPVRGVTLRLTSPPEVAVPARTIRALVDGTPCYFVPRSDGSLVLGATSEEQRDARVARAGGVFQLLDAGRKVVPLLDELHLAEVAVGLRPATPDHIPRVSVLTDARIVAAVGHYRNGVLLAPLAGRRAADLVRGFL
jgi:glycine oxidase